MYVCGWCEYSHVGGVCELMVVVCKYMVYWCECILVVCMSVVECVLVCTHTGSVDACW